MRFHIRRLVVLALSSTCLAVVLLNTLRPHDDTAEDPVQEQLLEPPVQVEQKQVSRSFLPGIAAPIKKFFIIITFVYCTSSTDCKLTLYEKRLD